MLVREAPALETPAPWVLVRPEQRMWELRELTQQAPEREQQERAPERAQWEKVVEPPEPELVQDQVVVQDRVAAQAAAPELEQADIMVTRNSFQTSMAELKI